MLGYTPSAVSQQVKRLERQVGVPLLERVGRGVMLTGPGRQLVDDGSRLLGDLERIEAGLHRTAGTVAGHLRLAAFSTAVRGLVAPALRPLLDAHPELSPDRLRARAVGHRRPGRGRSRRRRAGAQLGRPAARGARAPDLHRGRPGRRRRPRRGGPPAGRPVPGHPARPGRRVLDRDPRGDDLPAVAAADVRRHRPRAGRGARVDGVRRPTSRWCRPGWASRWSRGSGRGELPEGVVAVPAHDPVPTRQITVLHRRSMAGSPAVRCAGRRAAAADPPGRQRAAASRPLSSALAGCTRGRGR